MDSSYFNYLPNVHIKSPIEGNDPIKVFERAQITQQNYSDVETGLYFVLGKRGDYISVASLTTKQDNGDLMGIESQFSKFSNFKMRDILEYIVLEDKQEEIKEESPAKKTLFSKLFGR